jgi:hypothetical protein
MYYTVTPVVVRIIGDVQERMNPDTPLDYGKVRGCPVSCIDALML